MAIQLLSSNELNVYDSFIATHSDSTPFHTIEWMKLTANSFGFKPVYVINKDEKGQIKAALPLFDVRVLFKKKLVSLPLRDKGGVLFHDLKYGKNIIDFIIEYAKKNCAAYIHIKTDNPEEAELLERKSFVKKDEWLVSYIPLEKTFEATKKKFKDKRLNWAINKAKRSNLVFEEGMTLKDINDFYAIFMNNRKRLGVPPYSLKFFKNIYYYCIKNGQARLFFVSKDGIRLTTILIFLLQNKAYDVYSASLVEASQYRANDFQMYHVIQWLCHNGYREYDLGADSQFQESLLKYKRKWGTLTKPLYFYYYFNRVQDVVIRDSDHPKYQLLRKFWRKSPTLIFEKVGAYLMKYLA